MKSRVVAMAAALLPLFWSACSSPGKIEQQCPAISVLVDTSSLPVVRSGVPLASANILYTAQIQNARRDCDFEKMEKQVSASVGIDFHAVRARADQAASYKIPYFVAITTEGKILAKQEFWVQFGFEQGSKVSDFSDSVNSLVFNVARDKEATDYGILVGFQLTKAQLDFNRTVGRFAP